MCRYTRIIGSFYGSVSSLRAKLDFNLDQTLISNWKIGSEFLQQVEKKAKMKLRVKAISVCLRAVVYNECLLYKNQN